MVMPGVRVVAMSCSFPGRRGASWSSPDGKRQQERVGRCVGRGRVLEIAMFKRFENPWLGYRQRTLAETSLSGHEPTANARDKIAREQTAGTCPMNSATNLRSSEQRNALRFHYKRVGEIEAAAMQISLCAHMRHAEKTSPRCVARRKGAADRQQHATAIR